MCCLLIWKTILRPYGAYMANKSTTFRPTHHIILPDNNSIISVPHIKYCSIGLGLTPLKNFLWHLKNILVTNIIYDSLHHLSYLYRSVGLFSVSRVSVDA